MTTIKKILKVLGAWLVFLILYGFVQAVLGIPAEFNTLAGIGLLVVAIVWGVRTPVKRSNEPGSLPARPAPAGVSCPKCQSTQLQGARFCQQCGAELSDSPPVDLANAVPVQGTGVPKPESKLKMFGAMVAVALVLFVLIGAWEILKMRSDPRFPKLETITTDRVASADCSALVYIKGTVRRHGRTFSPSLGLVGMNGPLFVLGDASGEVTVRLPYGAQLPPVNQAVTAFGNITCPPEPVSPNRFLDVAASGLRPN